MRSKRIVEGEPRLVVLGRPDSRRISAFREAALQSGWQEPVVISYADYLTGRKSFAECVVRACDVSAGDATDEATPEYLVRVESPGENWEVEKLILQEGIEPFLQAGGSPVTAAELDRKLASRGEMHHPRQWFFGFQRVLQRLEREGRELPGLKWMSAPREIGETFDKRVCQQQWLAAGLPIPHLYEPVNTYDQLRKSIRGHHCRLFVKLRYGFSAMGAVALEWCGDKVRAITTVETVWSQGTPRLFLSKKVRVLQREFEIAWLIDTLAREEVLVEEWLPKARLQGRPFDLRVVTIGGKGSHVVGRGSFSPFTNLNLDGLRINAEAVAQRLGSAWPEALSLCEQGAAAFPQSLAVGMDLLVRPCRKRFALLEANAFGDYLPGLLHDGQCTYTAELQALRQQERVTPCSR